MAVVTVPAVTALSAGHPLTAITARTKQAAVNDAAGAASAGSGGVELTAGSVAEAGANAVLTVAGIAAVLSALSTYYAALSTTQKALIGKIEVQVNPSGLRCTVRGADAASFTSTLAAALNTTSNYGTAGT